jgi:hypothetical protein
VPPQETPSINLLPIITSAGLGSSLNNHGADPTENAVSNVIAQQYLIVAYLFVVVA